MRVKILPSANPYLWYGDKIGEEFEVYPTTYARSEEVIHYNVINTLHTIAPQDCRLALENTTAQSPAPIRVRIKSAHPEDWYRGLIGKEITVIPNNIYPDYYVSLSEPLTSDGILKTDCEVISEIIQPEITKPTVQLKIKREDAPTGQIQTILQEAQTVVYGDRQASYGSVTENFTNIAALWSATLKTPITPQQVGLCLIQLKVARQMNKPKRDNLVDIAGYAATLEKLEKGE